MCIKAGPPLAPLEMRTPSLLNDFCVAFVLLGALSFCAAMHAPDHPSLRDIRRARREITEALAPSVAPSPSLLLGDARAGVGVGGLEADPAPDEPLVIDSSFIAADTDAVFIAADAGLDTETAQEAATFVGTETPAPETATPRETVLPATTAVPETPPE